jgi:chromatin remodeling complex protein RSC6
MSSSTAIRVFRGCSALLAPAKSSTSTAGAAVKISAAAPKPKAKPKPKPKASGDVVKPKRNVNRTAGILKPTPISPALGSFLGAPESSRAEAVKQIWAHIKLHNLQVLISISFGSFSAFIMCVKMMGVCMQC